MKSPFPRLSHWMVRQTKSYRTAKAYKDEAINKLMQETLRRFHENPKAFRENSALGHLIRRELTMAEKEGRKPE